MLHWQHSAVPALRQAWLALRADRLTASSLPAALGLFWGDRERLWREKVGLSQPEPANQAMLYGSGAEAGAAFAYEQLTGACLSSCRRNAGKDCAGTS